MSEPFLVDVVEVARWTSLEGVEYGPQRLAVMARPDGFQPQSRAESILVPAALLRAHDFRLRGHDLEIDLSVGQSRLRRLDGEGTIRYELRDDEIGTIEELPTASLVGALALDAAEWLSPELVLPPKQEERCRRIVRAIASEWSRITDDDRPRQHLVARRLRRLGNDGRPSGDFRADSDALGGWAALTELRPAT